MTDKTYHLSNWMLQTTADNYTAPEAVRMYLVGFREEDQNPISTSYIVAVNGCEVKTHSGSTYILGEVSLEYLAWLTVNGYNHDPENPIKVKK